MAQAVIFNLYLGNGPLKAWHFPSLAACLFCRCESRRMSYPWPFSLIPWKLICSFSLHFFFLFLWFLHLLLLSFICSSFVSCSQMNRCHKKRITFLFLARPIRDCGRATQEYDDAGRRERERKKWVWRPGGKKMRRKEREKEIIRRNERVKFERRTWALEWSAG